MSVCVCVCYNEKCADNNGVVSVLEKYKRKEIFCIKIKGNGKYHTFIHFCTYVASTW